MNSGPLLQVVISAVPPREKADRCHGLVELIQNVDLGRHPGSVGVHDCRAMGNRIDGNALPTCEMPPKFTLGVPKKTVPPVADPTGGSIQSVRKCGAAGGVNGEHAVQIDAADGRHSIDQTVVECRARCRSAWRWQ